MSRPSAPLLPLGLYDALLSQALHEQLAAMACTGVEHQKEPLDPGDSHVALAEHLGRILREALASLSSDNRLAQQIELCNQLVHILTEKAGEHFAGSTIANDGERLLAVYPAGTKAEPPERPDTPLGAGTLLTGTRLDPSLASQLRKELKSADRVDILCSFIKWSGVRMLEEPLRAFVARPGASLRVITTSYLGATDLRAVEFLSSLQGCEVRISYDTRRTRLHAKAYLFYRESGFGSAYIGSANLSGAALTDGLEWTIKVSQSESSHLWNRVAATFETYWNDPEFVAYTEGERPRLQAALAQESGTTGPDKLTLFDLRPYPFQQEILDRLDAERRVQGRERHLVVAATGTGKTMIAAFDYRNWCHVVAPTGARPRLLFVAHREELLRQSLASFRAVLRDANFGDLLVGGSQPASYDHLFVSVQSYNAQQLDEHLPADHFTYVVIDEFHHAAAPSYRRLLEVLRPRVLLGLTATPERGDGLDILGHFAGHMSAQIRLPDAINRGLLCAFQYFGVTDPVSLCDLQWQRGGYRTVDLDHIYTGNDARAALIVEKVHEVLLDPRRARGLGFCVSVAHAEYMAIQFTRHGVPADSLSGHSAGAHREQVQGRLCRREINFLFVVDLYNEGVDIPEVDTILFLRPTESLTVFLQQLGRGLRLCAGKDCLTVLDFIGQAHRNFRFDLRFRALLPDPLLALNEQAEQGFPLLPSGCSIQLERIARQHVLENIRQALRVTRQTLEDELRQLTARLGRVPFLGEFLECQGLDSSDLYRRKMSYARLCVQAGVRDDFADPDEEVLARGLHRVCHLGSAAQIRSLQHLLDLDSLAATDLGITEARHLLMLDLSLWGRGQLPATGDESIRRLARNPTLRAELLELLAHRLDQIGEVQADLSLPFLCPLTLHATYTRDEILAALGHWTRQEQREFREGVLHLQAIAADLLLVTLNKTEKDYSPTTMYQDYAISDRLFHWQSQSTTSPESPTGRRYIEHASRDHTILLFAREDRKVTGLSSPYYFLGSAQYAGHTGSRPMNVTWRLDRALPARLLRRMARLATG